MLAWTSAALVVVYGTLTALAGLGQLKVKRIQAWAACGMILCGLAVDAAAVLMVTGSTASAWVLAAGLAGIHLLALNNGRRMFGRVNPFHHLARLVISVLLLWLAVLALR